MGRACVTHREQNCIQNFGEETRRDHLENLSLDVWIILKLLLWKQDRKVNWIHLAHDRKNWHTLVNATTNLQVR
jgi:hypothetical protein